MPVAGAAARWWPSCGPGRGRGVTARAAGRSPAWDAAEDRNRSGSGLLPPRHSGAGTCSGGPGLVDPEYVRGTYSAFLLPATPEEEASLRTCRDYAEPVRRAHRRCQSASGGLAAGGSGAAYSRAPHKRYRWTSAGSAWCLTQSVVPASWRSIRCSPQCIRGTLVSLSPAPATRRGHRCPEPVARWHELAWRAPRRRSFWRGRRTH
jgi:hypothetical protein